MKILLLLLCATFAHAQMPEITSGKCAGKDPIFLWGGGGPNFGEFQLVVGDQPCDGPFFKIDHGKSSSIKNVTTWFSINGESEKVKLRESDNTNSNAITVGYFYGLTRGDVIRFRYIITRKKEPKA